MKTPNLNRALVLETAERVADGAGGFAIEWRPLGTVWAQVDARSGREVSGAMSALSKLSLRITVRGAPRDSVRRPVAGQRFREGTRHYAINAVAEDASGRFLICHSHEEVSQ